MASYELKGPTAVKWGYGSNNWQTVSSGGTYSFGKTSGGVNYVAMFQFTIPSGITNISQIILYAYGYPNTDGGAIAGRTTVARLSTSTPYNASGSTTVNQWVNFTGYLSQSNTNAIKTPLGNTYRTYSYAFTSGLSTLTAGSKIYVYILGVDNSSYSDALRTTQYPYLDITYGNTTPTTYRITYYKNDGSGTSSTPRDQSALTSGSSYTLKYLSQLGWSRSGYTFKGWGSSSSATSTSSAGTSKTCYGNTSWYAIWQSDVSIKTISFYPISTSGLVGDYPGQITASSNNSYFRFPTMSDLKWTRSGFTLQYWNTNRQLSGTNYYPGSSYQIAYSDLQDSYYAVWQPSTPSTVTFTFDPGSYSDDSKVSYTRSYFYSSSSSVSLPNGDDYFTGRSDSGSQQFFYLTCDCGAGSFSNGVSVAQVSNDWTRLQTQYVQNGWSLNNGVTSAPLLTSYTPDRDVTFYPYWGGERISNWEYDIVLKIPNEQPTRSGYSFVEWNTSSSGTGTSYQPGGSIRQLKTNGYFSNKTLYAIWQASEFKITFSPGNYGQGRSKELTTTNGQLTTLPSDYFTRPAGTTYYFNYYLQGGTMSTPPGFSVDTSATYGPHYQTSNKTTYYHNYWNTDPNGSPKNNMGVDCWSCGATYSFTSDMTIYPEWGSSVPKYTLPTPTKVGYKFVAWNTNASGTGTNYAAGTEFALRSNKTFYAIWEPEWTIKINNGTNWGDYHVWIYTGTTSNNGWQQAIPYVYDGSNWKLTKI